MEFVTTLGETKHYYDQQMMFLQQKATEILSTCSKRPLIALDLDYTLWPANCFEHTAPPYRNIEDQPKGSKDSTLQQVYHASAVKEKILCIDRRTNHERSLVLFPQIKSILEWCADHRIVLTIVSKSPDLSIVKQILQAFGIWDWFLFPQIYNSRKTYHFRNLTEATGFKMNDFLFYDDDHNNVTMCSRVGVTSCHVDKQAGLTWNTFLEGLASFANHHKSVNQLSNWLHSENRLSASKGSPKVKVSGVINKTPSPRPSIASISASPTSRNAGTVVRSLPPSVAIPALTIPLTTSESK